MTDPKPPAEMTNEELAEATLGMGLAVPRAWSPIWERARELFAEQSTRYRSAVREHLIAGPGEVVVPEERALPEGRRFVEVRGGWYIEYTNKHGRRMLIDITGRMASHTPENVTEAEHTPAPAEEPEKETEQ